MSSFDSCAGLLNLQVPVRGGVETGLSGLRNNLSMRNTKFSNPGAGTYWRQHTGRRAHFADKIDTQHTTHLPRSNPVLAAHPVA